MGVFSTIAASYPDAAKRKGIYAQFPEDMDDWSCSQWMAYHRDILVKHGRASAKYYIEQDAGRVGWVADLNECKYDCDFVKYFAAYGMSVGNIFSNLYCAATTAVTAVKDSAQAVSNTTKGVANATSILSSGKLFIAAGIIGGIWWLNKKSNGKSKNK
jgi:hypothetical protein